MRRNTLRVSAFSDLFVDFRSLVTSGFFHTLFEFLPRALARAGIGSQRGLPAFWDSLYSFFLHNTFAMIYVGIRKGSF